jgi:hypothetical protein
MASGILAKSDPTGATETTVYTAPSGKTTSCTISVCNRSTSDASKIRIGLTDLSVLTANSYIEYEAAIPPTGVLERSAIVLLAGQKIIVRPSTSDLSVVVFGVEE